METKKMTIAEAQEFVRNTKYIVFSEDESKKLQTKLFEIGCQWITGRKYIYKATAPFLFVNHDLLITFVNKNQYKTFDNESNQIKSADDVINIEIEQEPKPKFDPKTLQPFDKVLVRDNEQYKWKCDMLSHVSLNSDYPFTCIGSSWKCCVPYNDETKHLLGTSDEAPEFYQVWK